MIGINMSMPDNCYKCPFNDREDLCYIDGTSAIADLMTKPHWCPLIEIKERRCEMTDYTKAIEALELSAKKAEEAIKIFKQGLDKAEEQAKQMLWQGGKE